MNKILLIASIVLALTINTSAADSLKTDDIKLIPWHDHHGHLLGYYAEDGSTFEELEELNYIILKNKSKIEKATKEHNISPNEDAKILVLTSDSDEKYIEIEPQFFDGHFAGWKVVQ